LILIIDNYDSFTYNLVQYLGELGLALVVMRHDAITVSEIERMGPSLIVLSPGPGRPEGAGICIDVIRRLAGKIPIFGVCLGHQAIGAAFGGEIISAPSIMHGKVGEIFHDGRTVFTGLPNPFLATRYHSLVVSERDLPDCFMISAQSAEGTIMGLRHRSFPLEGVQFHPESIMTTVGKNLLSNVISRVGGPSQRIRNTSGEADPRNEEGCP
jgi:anthranilate synthase/aminodeoxychorismate synthase-like glutamine amidotransferase